MKILKHGNQVKEEKLHICPKCECEFVPDSNEFYYDEEESSLYCLCPDCMTRVYNKEITEKTKEKSLLDRYIDEILDYFDFDRVHTVMKALDWGWATCNNKVPSIEELKENAKYLLREAWERKSSVATGGFYAIYNKNTDDDEYGDGLELNFQVDGCAVYLNQDNNMVELF